MTRVLTILILLLSMVFPAFGGCILYVDPAGSNADGKTWKFCDPKATIDVIKAGLDCYQGEDGKTAVELKIFLEHNVDKIIKNAELYTKAQDCQLVEEKYKASISDGPITWD